MSTLMDEADSWAAAAHHEAGHAAVALLLGAPIVFAQLGWGKVRRGRRDPEGMVRVDDSFTDHVVFAHVAAAGPVAEGVWGAARFDVRFEDAYRLADRQNPSDAGMLRGHLRQARLKRRHVVAKAVELTYANWPLITRIAELLSLSGHLSGREIEALHLAGRQR